MFSCEVYQIFQDAFLQNTSGWLLLLNTLFCLLRQPQPQKLFPSALVILNILETNIVNCLRIAPSGGPSQLRPSWFIANRASGVSEMLLELEAVAQLSSVQMRFCKTSQISQKTYKMESLLRKTVLLTVSPQACNCTKMDTITSVFLWICSLWLYFFIFIFVQKYKSNHRRCSVKKMFQNISQISKDHVGVSF